MVWLQDPGAELPLHGVSGCVNIGALSVCLVLWLWRWVKGLQVTPEGLCHLEGAPSKLSV